MKAAILSGATAAALVLGVGLATAQEEAPFGDEASVGYAEQLYAAMEELCLAGENAIDTMPYPGSDPHGAMLETFHTTLELEGHTGHLSVKRNYAPASREEVQGARDEHLASITVMYQREDGYDPDNMNWFWVKYLPDGSLDRNPQGMALAGRVAKGADQGCIACHGAAPGGDYLYTTDFVR
ncbi:cytochrome P460 family protein [Salinarimonas sp.]|uniref:cytochrome P460 family protein n=1 Tax=Salinarimonas sp. TaxID=2766526 RepID=UPI0032D9A088